MPKLNRQTLVTSHVRSPHRSQRMTVYNYDTDVSNAELHSNGQQTMATHHLRM